ncbi:MAG: hypothetical protein M1819_004406 [Sarea resinae]|nr:MAG: hypothetical protein M1819_004406 [Sarea resinae]
MVRRPPGALRAVHAAILSFLFILPLLVAGQQQQQRVKNGESPREPAASDTCSSQDASAFARRHFDSSHKFLKDTAVISHTENAVATLAPAALQDAARAPPARFTGQSAGLSSLLQARSLLDWAVEDLVLLATLDGSLYARDRYTGAARWTLEVDKPMIETIYYRKNDSMDGDRQPENDFEWIVEPSRDGKLYIYTPGPDAGLQKLDLTVKKLVEGLSPYAGENPAVVYTAEKKTTLYTVDAASGKILKTFSASGSSVNEERSCRRVSALEVLDDEECGSSGTLIIGRTEYTVGIQNRDTGDLMCTLKFAEWGPNNRDTDLYSQYETTMDNNYIYPRPDGSFFSFNHGPLNQQRKLYTQKLVSPVAQIFDVARPLNSEARDASLVILPQPVIPLEGFEINDGSLDHGKRIFINSTESGGWFAMSEDNYPLVIGGAALAPCCSNDWSAGISGWDMSDQPKSRHNLVGVHYISKHEGLRNTFATISGPEIEQTHWTPRKQLSESPPIPSLPGMNGGRPIESALMSTVNIALVVVIFVTGILVYLNKGEVDNIVASIRRLFVLTRRFTADDGPLASQLSSSVTDQEPLSYNDHANKLPEMDVGGGIKTNAIAPSTNSGMPASERILPGVPIEAAEPEAAQDSLRPETEADEDGVNATKRRSRGKRAGQNVQQKRARRAAWLARQEEQAAQAEQATNAEVDRVVEEVIDMQHDVSIEPDVVRVDGSNPRDITDTSGSSKIGDLIITEEELGTGNSGTTVYKGSFEGRDVAVKRMLKSHYDIAAHEVSLLQESDGHPNVVRYFCKQQNKEFLFLALELLPATLSDVFDKEKTKNSKLYDGYNLDLPKMLLQMARGVSHLHALKIVHRDLKPKNILVGYCRSSPDDPGALVAPRVVITDFGLCKRLEQDKESFAMTTAKGAGTTGWRAPEVLVGAVSTQPATGSESTHSSSTEEAVIVGSSPTRRATRAIDIFGLGLVYFYVLSGGLHAFGRDELSRDLNIVNGKYDLSPLDTLGDYAYEAKDLISMMLHLDSHKRPTAKEVMLHPFFWSTTKRLNFFCDISDHLESGPKDKIPPPYKAAHTAVLESHALNVIKDADFLKQLPRDFLDTLGKQRKYSGHKMIDLLRALRNKKSHYDDMPDSVKAHVGPLPDGYLHFWTIRFPRLLMECYYAALECELQTWDRFNPYFYPSKDSELI